MDLDNILKQIYPDENQINCLSGIVSSLGNILKNSSGYLKIKKVTPAGSLGKKTILKNHLEVDCVYILEHNGYSYMNNFWEVQRTLQDNLPGVTNLKTLNHSLGFTLTRRIGDISVDLLPAFEINGPRQIMEVKNRDTYYGSTSLLQKKYFKNIVQEYPRFTDLVRLLKLWRNSHDVPLSSYMLELMVANAICDTRQGESFEFFLEVCFRTIQSFTDGRKIVPVYWDDYFDNSEINYRYSRSNLWIIDPSDPSENLAKDISENEREYINSLAINGVNNMHNGIYTFLYK
jgi:tRNA nucleotidyltransferase (CCA-adding enzyme)